jgi:hypothetical protein
MRLVAPYGSVAALHAAMTGHDRDQRAGVALANWRGGIMIIRSCVALELAHVPAPRPLPRS